MDSLLRDQKVGESAFQGADDFNGMIMSDDNVCVECNAEPDDNVAIVEGSVPSSPSQEEKDIHELTHFPFKNWCAICVKAKANTPGHFKRKPDAGGRIPRLSMDYMFLPIGEDVGMTAIIVLKDSKSKQVWSRIVNKKGSQAEGLTDYVASIIRDLGYPKLKFRSDQEASMKDVQAHVIQEYQKIMKGVSDDVASKVSSTVIPEHSGVGDSQGNGDIEEAVQRTQKQIRAIKGQIEKKTNRKVEAGDPIWHWIVENAGTMIRRFSMGSDGITPFERHRGEASIQPWAHIGEQVWYKPAKTVDIGKEEDKWLDGIAVGMLDRTSEYLLATRNGVIKTPYEPRRRPAEDQWSMEEIKKIRGTPWRPTPSSDSEKIPTSVSSDGIPEGMEESQRESKVDA